MGSFDGVFSNTEALGTQRANNAMARSCLMRMATDLGSIYVEKAPLFAHPDTSDAPNIYRFMTGRISDSLDNKILLQFASRAHVDLSGRQQQGIAVIRYYLEPIGDKDMPLFRLRRSDTVTYGDELPELKADPIICDKIVSLTFQCIGEDGEAVEEWDSTSNEGGNATPRAVSIRLELFTPGGPSVYQTVVTLPLWRESSGKV